MRKYGFILLGLLLAACQNTQQRQYLAQQKKLYASWIGRKLILPVVRPGDTLCVNCRSNPFAKGHGNLIISVFDVSCSSCMETLDNWKKFDQVMAQHHIATVFVIPPELFEMYQRQAALFKGLTLYFDQNYNFIEKNKVDPNKALETYLVDKDDKVLILGNPIMNEQIKSIYFEYLKSLR